MKGKPVEEVKERKELKSEPKRRRIERKKAQNLIQTLKQKKVKKKTQQMEKSPQNSKRN